MKLAKAEDVISRLDAASAKRLHNYVNTLCADRDHKLFDDRMYNYLVSQDKLGIVEETKNYLDSIGFCQSKYQYSQIEQQIQNFVKPGVPSKAWNKFYKEAYNELSAEVRTARLKTMPIFFPADVLDLIPKEDTHAGFSFILTGDRTKGEYKENLFSNFHEQITLAKQEGSFNKPILIGTRTQASGAFDSEGKPTGTYKAKSRLVSMIDIYQVMAETIFAKPFQKWLSLKPWYAGGKDDTTINTIVQKQVFNKMHTTTIDYSNYDQSISAWLIHDAFDIIKQAFNCGHFDDELFEIIRMDLIHKVFIDGTGKLVYADKGVPSGSMFTQIIDSIVNKLMIDTYMKSKGINGYSMIIMGDDNLIFTSTPVDVEDLSGYLGHMFGITINPKKCSQGQPGHSPEFLSRYWTLQGCDRDKRVLISKLLYPERFRDYGRAPVDNLDVMIVHAYYLSYPVAMKQLVGQYWKDESTEFKTTEIRKTAKYLSGLMKYRLKYLNN